MPTVVFPDPETADAVQAQLEAGVLAIQAARDLAAGDIPTAEGLQTDAQTLRGQAQTQRAQVAAFVPGAAYRAADIAAIRDQLAIILDRQALILQALADTYSYRAAVDRNAVLTDDALLWLARLAAGIIDDPNGA